MTPEERNAVIAALKREVTKTAIWAAVCVGLAVATVKVGMFVLPLLFA